MAISQNYPQPAHNCHKTFTLLASSLWYSSQ
jgi:hypothetical protein